MLTAVSVARQCGMVRPKERVVMVLAHPPDSDKPAQVEWEFAETEGADSEAESEILEQESDITEVKFKRT